MAENIREDEGKVDCPLCSSHFQSAKAAKWHLDTKHKGDPGLAEAVKSVGNDECPYCRRPKSNLVLHKRTCGARPKPEAPQQQAASANRVVQQDQRQRPPHPYEGLSNSDMVDKFEERMTSRFKLDPKGTVPDYRRDVKKFIQHELDLDPSFRAFTWFIYGTEQNIDPRWRAIRQFGEYREKYITKQGRKTVERMNTVYGHLVRWIKEEVNQQLADPISLLEQSVTRAREERAVDRRCGAFKPGQGRKEKSDSVPQKLDVNITREIQRVFVNSPLHEETMTKFARGDYIHEGCKDKACDDCRCRLVIKEPQDVQNFLALHVFLCQFGLRLEVTSNVTLGGLLGATAALEVCPHCGGHYIYAEHKKLCHR